MKITSRRYLGGKRKLTPFIREVVDRECRDVKRFFDVFAGTGAVSAAFLDKTLFVNDSLYVNYLAYLTWFSNEQYNPLHINSLIERYNALEDVDEENYMSENFADTYFSRKTCAKIGRIRENIEQLYTEQELNERERAILITSLVYAIDKVANTCGHYDAYRKGAKFDDDFVMELPDIFEKVSSDNRCFNEDANVLAKKIVCDLAYLDPPYNSRQYCDLYHVLENVARWKKPQVYGVARKMDRSRLKSDFCTNDALKAFERLVDDLDCRYILLSYNNTGDKANERSNARISDEQILRVLSRKGKVKVFSKQHKAFTAGKSHNDDNEERLFLCTVEPQTTAPPLNYTGGKAKLWSQLKPQFPEKISSFVDLFCGGGAVGANVRAERYYYNDLSTPLIGLLKTFYKTDVEELTADIENLIISYDLSNSAQNGYAFYGCNSSDGLGNYNRDRYLKLRNDFNAERTRNKRYYEMFFVLIVYSFNNQIRFNSSGNFNLPVGKRDFNEKMKEKLFHFTTRLQAQNPIFSNGSFQNFDISQLDRDSLVYCDPPYLITTASYNENGGWTEADELTLLSFLDELNSRKIKFALSNVLCHKGRKNEILACWLNQNKYNVNYLNFNYKNSNYQSKNKDAETQEVLVVNYQE